MLERYLRSHYQTVLVNPLARSLTNHSPLLPSLITGLALLTGLFIPVFLYFQQPYLACLMLIVSGYCDTLDGTVARYNQSTSAVGTVFDIVADRLVEFLIVLGLYAVAPIDRALYCFFMLGSILLCITSFLVVSAHLSDASEKGFHYSPGLIERAEAFVFFAAMILVPSWFKPLAILFTLLVFATAVIRVGQFVRVERKASSTGDSSSDGTIRSLFP